MERMESETTDFKQYQRDTERKYRDFYNPVLVEADAWAALKQAAIRLN